MCQDSRKTKSIFSGRVLFLSREKITSRKKWLSDSNYKIVNPEYVLQDECALFFVALFVTLSLSKATKRAGVVHLLNLLNLPSG